MQSVKLGGKTHALGNRIGKGGEGEVYVLQHRPDQAVKIYNESLRGRREPKVRAMISSALAAKTDIVAFPAEIVTDLHGGFIGFVMRLVAGYRPVHELYSPKSRKLHYPKADYRFLVRAALNIARAVGKVHQAGCIVGDFNHSGVLVSNDATVALIDADSFQFTVNGRSYPCVVGVPDFTSPELHGLDLSTVSRTKAHDNFGLAVAIFHLLAMGKHPYAGRFAGKDLTMSEAIAQNRFAFSLRRSAETRTGPPPGSITLKDFPPSIAQGFEAAFGLNPMARPDAATWVSLLKELEASLNHCSTIKTHYYPSAAGKCVWCRLATQSGVDMFPDLLGFDIPSTTGGSFEVEQILAQMKAVVLPQPNNLIPKWNGVPVANSVAVAAAKLSLMKRRAVGLVAIIIAVVGFIFAMAGVLLWSGLAIFGIFKFFSVAVDQEPLNKAYADADGHARQAELTFLQRIGLIELYGVRDDLENWVAAYSQLDAEVGRELLQLRTTREFRRREAYLDRFSIRNGRIKGIGPAKTSILASFGVETAADINANALRAIPGIGEVLTAELIAWRSWHEAHFRYNPVPDASDVLAENMVRSAAAAKRTELQSKVRSGLVALQSGPRRLAASARTADLPLMHALGERANAAQSFRVLGLAVPTTAPISIAKKQPAAATPKVVSHGTPTTHSGAPLCPKCGSPMLRRTARQGGYTGRMFWGCSRYPSCTGIRN